MRAQAFVRGTCVAVLVALLAACGARGPDFQASDITGASFDINGGDLMM